MRPETVSTVVRRDTWVMAVMPRAGQHVEVVEDMTEVDQEEVAVKDIGLVTKQMWWCKQRNPMTMSKSL